MLENKISRGLCGLLLLQQFVFVLCALSSLLRNHVHVVRVVGRDVSYLGPHTVPTWHFVVSASRVFHVRPVEYLVEHLPMSTEPFRLDGLNQRTVTLMSLHAKPE